MSAMPSNDPEDSRSLARRGFLTLAARAVLLLTGGAAADALSRYLSYEPPSLPARRITLEPLEAYPEGARVLVAAAAAVIFRDSVGIFARSLTCAHLGCRVRPSADGGFTCPCHGSRFTADGGRLSGPSPRGLDGLALTVDGDGRLVLDLTAKVDPAWRLAAPIASRKSPQTESDG
jgi:nitrite reductase/ring-hydroxylating ferredoxin subunit